MKKEIIDKLKREIAFMPQFDGKCYVCGKKFGKYFLFHHKKYLNSDKIWSDFKDSWSYNLYVLPVIKSDPNRFALLCKKHHQSVEMLKRFKPENLERLIKLVKDSQ